MRRRAQVESEESTPSCIATYLTIAQAAKLLAMTPSALRSRCNRNARHLGKDIVADLGDGIVAIKFGKQWRLRTAATKPIGSACHGC